MGTAEDTARGPKHISSFAAYCVILNYVIGTGVFAIPFAMHKAGQVVGVVCLLLGAVASYFTISYVVQAISRTELLLPKEDGDTSSLLDESGDPSPLNEILTSESEGEFKRVIHVQEITLRDNRQDYVVMCYLYGGNILRITCQVVLVLYCLTVLWSFTAVFSSSVSLFVFKYAYDENCDVQKGHESASCQRSYYICTGCFAVVAITLACFDVAEQAFIQMGLTLYRFVAFSVMVVTLLIAYTQTDTWSFKPQEVETWVDIRGFVKIFTTAVIAFNFHYNLPDVIQPVKNKRAAMKILACAFSTIFLFYVTLGCLGSIYFGDDTNPIVTLNWSKYNRGWRESDENRKTVWWSYIVQLVVNLFPIFDMLSVFPLVAISVGNNILSSLPASAHRRAAEFPRGEWLLKVFTRVLVSGPAILLASFLGQLDKIFEFVAIFAFFLAYVCPCLLELLSARALKKAYPDTEGKTFYSAWYHHWSVVMICLSMGIIAAILALVTMFVPI